jgi:uncharacterized RDD family membrane protein YckC
MEALQKTSWGWRFAAWLIDVIIVNVVLGVLGMIAAPILIPWSMNMPFDIDPVGWAINSIAFLAYWTYMEGRTGQSIGKVVMEIRVTGSSGERINYERAFVESFGKSFLLLLVFDLIIGILAMEHSKQRVFNRLSDTIVVRVGGESE